MGSKNRSARIMMKKMAIEFGYGKLLGRIEIPLIIEFLFCGEWEVGNVWKNRWRDDEPLVFFCLFPWLFVSHDTLCIFQTRHISDVGLQIIICLFVCLFVCLFFRILAMHRARWKKDFAMSVFNVFVTHLGNPLVSWLVWFSFTPLKEPK